MIDHEPVFRWWDLFTLNKRNIVIYVVSNRYWRLYCKFGIKLPYIVSKAYKIDRNTGDIAL